MAATNRPTLLIGSLNLASSGDVFEQVSERLRDQVRSVPDGETGDRGIWVAWEGNRIENLPGLEKVDAITFESPVAGEFSQSMLAPEPGVDLGDFKFGPFQYAPEARASYAIFEAARAGGKFHPETRFQVSIPTPMMFAMTFPHHRREALPVFERDLAAELRDLVDTIPPEDLAIQWDVAGETHSQEIFRLGGKDFADSEAWPLEEATESLARASRDIPAETLLGIHLCYGDPDGEHLVQPRDLSIPVTIANSVGELLDRRLDWVHMPVPIDRDDDAYFAPLDQLKLGRDTQLYLGLIHKEDGLDGAKRRIGSALDHVEDFGVATECGMGREPREAIPFLLDLHRQAAAL